MKWVSIVVFAFGLTLTALFLGFGFSVIVPFDSGSTWWIQFPWQAAVAFVGGGAALVTFFANRTQKQEHFERLELETRFKNILDQFAAKDDPLMRSSAASQLTDMAEHCLPGKPDKRTKESYRFYDLAAAHLTRALYMEKNEATRTAVARALRRMVEFEFRRNSRIRLLFERKDRQRLLFRHRDRQKLLVRLIFELRYANRSARRAFVEAVGVYLAAREATAGTERLPFMEDILPYCTFQKADDKNRYFLESIVDSSDVNNAVKRNPPLTTLQSDEGEPIRTVKLCADQLGDSIASFDFALRSLHAMNLMEGEQLDRLATSGDRRFVVDMSGCFLVGAALAKAELQAVDFSETNFQGAYMQEVNLQDAYLLECDLRRANLQGAILKGAFLAGAKLNETRLSKSCVDGASFEDANWWDANFVDDDGNEDTDLIELLKDRFPRTESSSNLPTDAT